MFELIIQHNMSLVVFFFFFLLLFRLSHAYASLTLSHSFSLYHTHTLSLSLADDISCLYPSFRLSAFGRPSVLLTEQPPQPIYYFYFVIIHSFFFHSSCFSVRPHTLHSLTSSTYAEEFWVTHYIQCRWFCTRRGSFSLRSLRTGPTLVRNVYRTIRKTRNFSLLLLWNYWV